MNEIDTFTRADRHLKAVVDQIQDNQWEMELPANFPTLDNRAYTVRQILNYQAYDEAWIPTMMAGTTFDEAGADQFGGPIDNDLLGDEPAEQFGLLVERSIDAVQKLKEGDLDDRIVTTPTETIRRVRRSGTPLCSELRALTISPRLSASTSTSPRTWFRRYGTSLNRTLMSGDRSGCSALR